MALTKHVVGVDGVGRYVEMSSDEETAFLASIPTVSSPVPASITRRQCARQMLAMELIDGPEALAMTRDGTPPAMVADMIGQMPANQRVLAQIDFAADAYQRTNPLLIALMTATGADAAAIDDFFRVAAQL